MEDKEKTLPVLEVINLKEPVTVLDIVQSEIVSKCQTLQQTYNTTPSVISYVQDLDKVRQILAETP
ncbi:hypothetical protein MTZ49_11025 [Entomomonas sp. E2T0]|uniref:hypothetical protein n=1 Tax=Entomomonas sp. E2T0 TaxID=2930213 RepID=UPI00222851EA|nr:hypothetical protein [Entomomonas sp. E2T0]UYZ83130.1 hypothetical protein MTZ49_11025 [Entomomonas sp. E2T0]